MIPVELLAPAKDYEHGCAAVDCGADALYVGAPSFGARAGVPVSTTDIGRLCDYAHRFGVRVFVTMNTLLYEHELRRAESLARQVCRAGADALIVQDAAFLRMDLPPVELHASTQMFNMDPRRAQFWASAGFSRIVLERAATLREIATIAESVPDTEIEAFVHGAVCVSYSGRCYMSRSLGPRSGNRGDCSQACRLPYDLLDERMHPLMRDKHLLSVCDLNLSDRIEAMIDSGVRSFKIEGRLKDMAYVRNIVGWYRRRIDDILVRRDDLERTSEGRSELGFDPDPVKSFSRGATSYFIDGPRRGVASFDTPKAMGEPLGRVAEAGGGRFVLDGEAVLSAGDGICFVAPSGRLAGTRLDRAEGRCGWPAKTEGIRPGTELFRNRDHRFVSMLERARVQRTLPLSACVTVRPQRLELVLDDGWTTVAVGREGRFDEARNAEGAQETIRTQIAKTGDTIYRIDAVRVSSDVPRFVPVSMLNDLRREGLAKMAEARVQGYVRRTRRPETPGVPFPQSELSGEENVTNSLAERFYREHGVERIEPGYDLSASLEGKRVMRMRYCLRRETGQCLRRNPAYKGRLFLGHDRYVYELLFECDRCEMSVVCRGEREKTNGR
ncbi:U32 family peptidase [uncultured Alistipes sp.]|uniref:peptidase U32 family protein n=1 Tax=uncultured Alistipes sp. TaxID=538949 RepID=UPI00262BF130|nr:U32 family peptidase [uncultured Alistipes sp.]